MNPGVNTCTERTNEFNKEFITWLLAPFFVAFNERCSS